jgi:hypothetical protein
VGTLRRWEHRGTGGCQCNPVGRFWRGEQWSGDTVVWHSRACANELYGITYFRVERQTCLCENEDGVGCRVVATHKRTVAWKRTHRCVVLEERPKLEGISHPTPTFDTPPTTLALPSACYTPVGSVKQKHVDACQLFGGGHQ